MPSHISLEIRSILRFFYNFVPKNGTRSIFRPFSWMNLNITGPCSIFRWNLRHADLESIEMGREKNGFSYRERGALLLRISSVVLCL